tara:strand:- start:1188 stop:1811 length:624 start_codon:yes stop_codon:yes gene_type:complete
VNNNDLTEGSVIFFSQDYTNHRRDWDEFSEVYESILLKLKDKYSNKNILYRLHPYIERQEYRQELNFHLDFAKKFNLETLPTSPLADILIKDNSDKISATYSIDSGVINTSLKCNIPSYHLYGVFVSNKIPHPYKKISDPNMFGWEYAYGIIEPTSDSEKWEDNPLIKNNKLYLNITDLSQVGSIDDVSHKTEIPSVKWDDLKWDKT